jgi:hypothetical protein
MTPEKKSAFLSFSLSIMMHSPLSIPNGFCTTSFFHNIVGSRRRDCDLPG